LEIDESFPSIKKRFDSIGIESTEETRRAYRDLLITAPGIGEHISGMILFDETIRQAMAAGMAFPRALEAAGIIPGIKVDQGAVMLLQLNGFEGDLGSVPEKSAIVPVKVTRSAGSQLTL
jgi:fructose-bisphosphate aldolase class I